MTEREVQERGCHAARYVRYISMFMYYVLKPLCGLLAYEKQSIPIELFECFIGKNDETVGHWLVWFLIDSSTHHHTSSLLRASM